MYLFSKFLQPLLHELVNLDVKWYLNDRHEMYNKFNMAELTTLLKICES